MWLWEPPKKNGKYLRPSLKNIRDLFVDYVSNLPEWVLLFLKKASFLSKKSFNLFDNAFEKKTLRCLGLVEPKELLSNLFPDRCFPSIVGMEYYKVMAKSKISLHKHCDNIADVDEGANDNIGAIRLFEATGVGSCLVTDSGCNMNDLFEEDSEVVTYSSTPEAIEKIKFLLDNEKYRQSVALAGQKRTLRDHTAFRRFEGLVQWLNEIC